MKNKTQDAESVFELPTAAQMKNLLRLAAAITTRDAFDDGVLRDIVVMNDGLAGAVFALPDGPGPAVEMITVWSGDDALAASAGRRGLGEAFTRVIGPLPGGPHGGRRVRAFRRALDGSDTELTPLGLTHAACSIATHSDGSRSALVLYRAGKVFSPRAVACARLIHSALDTAPSRPSAPAKPKLPKSGKAFRAG